MTGFSYTQRTLRACRERGLVAGIVEKWNPYVKRPDGGTGKREDLFGILDIIALDPQRGVIGIQSTSGNQIPDHRRKILDERTQETRDWLSTPGTVLELWGWRKVKRRLKDGSWGKGEYWEPRILVITLEDLDPYEPTSRSGLSLSDARRAG